MEKDIIREVQSLKREIKALREDVRKAKDDEIISLAELSKLMGICEKTIRSVLPKFPPDCYMTLYVEGRKVGKPVFFKSKLSLLSAIQYIK